MGIQATAFACFLICFRCHLLLFASFAVSDSMCDNHITQFESNYFVQTSTYVRQHQGNGR